MTQYYFVGTSLPPLQFGLSPEIGFDELIFLLQTNFSSADWEDVVIIRRFYDIENIRRYWRQEPLDPHGNLDKNALADRLLTHSGLPEYVLSFLDRYPKKEERLRRFSALLSAFYQTERKRAGGFVADYLDFERAHRLILVGFRAKRLGRDLAEELQDEEPYDPLVMQILAQKDAVEYVPPAEYSHLKGLFNEYYERPMAFYRYALEYRFHHIDALIGLEVFTIQRILGYLIQLILVEQWLELDRKRGQEKWDEIWQKGMYA